MAMGTLLGENVRKLRKARGLTLEQLALAANTDTGGLSKVERGIQGYSDALLQRIAQALGVPVAALFVEDSNVEPALIGTRKIPVIDYVQAGTWTAVQESRTVFDGVEFVLADANLGPRVFAMRIRGESMLPVFTEGDLIIVDLDVAPRPGDFVVAANGGDVVFKQYRDRGVNEKGQEVFELQPLNSLYSTIRSDITPMRIIGVMLEHRIYRKRSN